MLLTNMRLTRLVLLAIAACLPVPVVYAQSIDAIKIESAPKELQQFIQPLLETHPRFLAAQSELYAVRAKYEASTSALYNPELELESEKTDVRTSTIGLSQKIDWGDQQGSKTKIAQHQLNAAKAKFQQQRQLLVRDFLIALNEHQSKARLSVLSNRRLEFMQDFYRLAKKKYSAGDLSQVELDLAQLAYSESMMINAQILSEQIDAEQTFYSLYGESEELLSPSMPDLFIDFKPIEMPADLDDLLMSLPQIRMLRANVEANKSTVGLRKSESSADPTVTLWAGKDDKESLVGLSLSIPLNVRNNYNAEINVAENETVQAEQLAHQAWRDLRWDISAKTRHYQSSRKVWRQWQETGEITMHSQIKLLKRLWQIGDMSTTDYLVQIKQNLDTQSAAIKLQNILWTSWIMWLEATAEIEPWLHLNYIRN